NNRVTSKIKNLLSNFTLSYQAFKKLCQSSKTFKIDPFGSCYYLAETNQSLLGQICQLFSVTNSHSDKWQKGNGIVVPLLGKNQKLLGMIFVGSPENNQLPTYKNVLPILSFTNEFLRNYLYPIQKTEVIPNNNLEKTQFANSSKTLDRTRQQFVAMLVHDIRSPMTTVLGTLDLFLIKSRQKAEIKLTPNMISLISAAHDSCGQIIHLVTELLDLFRMEQLPLQLNKTAIIPQELMSKVVEECYNSALEKQIRLNFGCQSDIKPIIVDIHYLQRALINLLNNAIKYTPENGNIWFEARLSDLDNNLTFTVIDSGSGISEEEQSYIFDPYYQASNRSGQLGIGLGLAIVKNIALAHKGNVSVKSQVGIGSAFSLSIPIS
ncbi:MAG: HAMP domain-containing sensor histidine kinase, partial [Blastocatellia bacterium]